MTWKSLLIASSAILAASTATASQPDPRQMPTAPPGTPETRYCMRIEAVTGTRLESVKCWTRQEWAEQGVDVDKDWPKEGVAVIG